MQSVHLPIVREPITVGRRGPFPETKSVLFPPCRARRAWPLLALTLLACSPRFNWREVRMEGSALQALMPCKPETAVRSVPLLGSTGNTELHMHSCEAGDLKFALAWADVGEADRVPKAIQTWRTASLQAIRAKPQAVSAWTLKVPGAMHSEALAADGVSPQGQAVTTRTAYFSQGHQVFQAAVYGTRLPDEALDGFFAGLSLPAP
jgi:hypothetical protein